MAIQLDDVSKAKYRARCEAADTTMRALSEALQTGSSTSSAE